MEMRTLDRAAISMTALGFGAAPIGNLYTPVTDEDAGEAVESAWRAGVRYFDTAPHYGLGLSEVRLGNALRHFNRSEYVVSTKVGRLLRRKRKPSGSDVASGGFSVRDNFDRIIDYSALGVGQSLQESLGRLGLSYVDIVYVHDPDEHVDQVVEETLPALIELRKEGVVRAIGAGMNHWQPLLKFVEKCDIDVVMLAGRWTLLDRSGARLLSACEERGISVVAAAPFNSGVLASNEPQSTDTFDYQTISRPRLVRARALAALCSRFNVDLPQVALQFPLRHSAVVAVVAGMRNASEVASDSRWMDAPIPPELWDELKLIDEDWSLR
jgi:D-threo-aldose 1-dehydrogenase